jgi:hypothetical protein
VGIQDLAVAEKTFSLFRAFGLGGPSTDVGNYLMNAYLGKAEAWPARLYDDYLNAARVARKIEDHETMDECVGKFLSLCEENGKNDPSVYAKGFEAAIEFGMGDWAVSLGKSAYMAFVPQGRYAEAHKIASKMACNAHHPSVEASGQELLSAIERLMVRLV